MSLEPKPVGASAASQVHLITYTDLNGEGRLFGGVLMMWIDVLAGVVARRHCECQVTTAAVDSLNFIGPAHLDETLLMQGKIMYVGSTSMEVCVCTYVEELSGKRQLINTAFFIMVAIDKDEKPQRVPGLILLGDEDREQFEAGRRRYALRKERRKEHY